MPETRYKKVYTYPKGLSAKDKILKNAVVTDEPYEVSDEELHQEELDHQGNDGSHELLDWYNNWDILNPKQKEEAMKRAIWFVLCDKGLL